MKAIWMHGMGGSPNEEKISMMEKHGLTTHALHIDYSNEPKRFEILRDYCIEHNIELLIGSSFGGFLGFWLSEELGIPCLLLNPAVSLSGKKKTKPESVKQLKSTLCLVAVGDQDTQIDHDRTLKFMDKDRREGKTIITKVLTNEGHGFSMEAFQNILEWGLTEIKNHKYVR